MRTLACLALAACGTDALVIAPAIDSPTNESAQPFPNLDSVVLGVAHAGQEVDVVSETFTRGQTLALDGVPFDVDLVVHMSGLIGTGEVAYGRTCTFAFSADSAALTPHLYFSRIVQFGELAATAAVRRDGTGLAIEGAGLIIGGVDDTGAPVASVEQFDPRTGVFAEVAQVEPRAGEAVALFGTNPTRVVRAGGERTDGSPATFLEIITPDTDTSARVDQIDAAAIGRRDASATTLGDGRVLVIGGAVPGSAPSDELDLIDATSGVADAHQLHVNLAHARRGHTAIALGDDTGADVLVIGGVDAAGLPVANAELFKPLSATFAPQLPTMLVPRTHHRAQLLPDNSVLVIGGVDANGAPVRQLERFDVDTGFSDAGQLPAGAGALDLSATTLPDGRVLLAGGRATPGGPALDSAFIAQLDLVDGTVEILATDHLSRPRAGHQATLLCDGTVLFAGGADGPAAVERYDPPATARR